VNNVLYNPSFPLTLV